MASGVYFCLHLSVRLSYRITFEIRYLEGTVLVCKFTLKETLRSYIKVIGSRSRSNEFCAGK